jgi:hypothetical protein
MKINSDFKDLLRELNAAGVRYLIVGGYAVTVYTEPSYTKELDVWIEPAESNARKLLTALDRFGVPNSNLGPSDFTEPEVFFQIGVEPVRVDIMTSVPGLEVNPAWDRKLAVDFGGETSPGPLPRRPPGVEEGHQPGPRSS